MYGDDNLKNVKQNFTGAVCYLSALFINTACGSRVVTLRTVLSMESSLWRFYFNTAMCSNQWSSVDMAARVFPFPLDDYQKWSKNLGQVHVLL
jgi:hypothetical protein